MARVTNDAPVFSSIAVKLLKLTVFNDANIQTASIVVALIDICTLVLYDVGGQVIL